MSPIRAARTLLLAPLMAASFLATTTLSALANYTPEAFPAGGEVSGVLSAADIPSNDSGHFRDYSLQLQAGDHLVIELISEEFDPVVSLISRGGGVVGENDDGPDGTLNSLLFTRVTTAGTYLIRVRSFAGTGSGRFLLRVTRLRPVGL